MMRALDLNQLAENLETDDGMLWRAKDRADISYPIEGNDAFFQVEESSFWFNYRNRFILEVVQNHPPAGILLDVGGGNGYVSLALQKAGYDTVLVEPGSSGVANAAGRGVQKIVQAGLEQARFREHAISAVGMFDVLEHIRDDGAFLDEVKRVLVPGGRLFLTVPAFAWLWSAADINAGHYRRYTRRSLIRLLNRHGFQVEFSSYLFSGLILPIFLFRSIPTWLGLRKKRDVNYDSQELSRSSGGIERFVGKMLEMELRWIRAGRALRLGSSCVVAARALEV